MPEHDLPEISISDEKLCFIIEKAREFNVKDVVTDPDSGSNPADDAMIAVLEDHPGRSGGAGANSGDPVDER